MLALRERRTWLRLPIMNTHEGTEGTEGLVFWHKLDFLSVKISWISRNTRRLWHMMNAMTIPMKMIAWWSSLCLRSWFSISGLILKDISNFVHKIVRKKVKQKFPLLRSKRDMMIQRSNSSQMSIFRFKHFWCNEFLAFFGNARNYVPAFPKNAGNSLHQRC